MGRRASADCHLVTSKPAATTHGTVRVAHVIGGAQVGGTERQLLLLLEHLDSERIASTVTLIRGGPLESRFRAAAPTTVLPKRGRIDPVFAWRLGRHLRAIRPDVVHTWGSTANLWGAVATALVPRVPLIVADRALEEWKGGILRAADRGVYRRATVVAANSSAVRAASIARGAPADRTAVVPNGVVTPGGAEVTRQPGLVLSPGRLDPRKAQDVLIAAVPEIAESCPDVYVVLAGPAVHPQELDYADLLRAQIERLGLADRVELRGAVDDLGPLYRTASVVAVPSRSEGSPNAVLEALAYGTPVVASVAGGIPEVVTDGETGWLVEPDDHRALAAAIVDALGDTAEAARRAAAGRDLVRTRFSAQSVARQWTDWYEAVVRLPRADQ